MKRSLKEKSGLGGDEASPRLDPLVSHEISEAARRSRSVQFFALWLFVVGLPIGAILVELKEAKAKGTKFTSTATLCVGVTGIYLFYRLNRWSSKR